MIIPFNNIFINNKRIILHKTQITVPFASNAPSVIKELHYSPRLDNFYVYSTISILNSKAFDANFHVVITDSINII